MKKIISLALVCVMIVCALAVNVSAAGTLYFDADFSSDATFSNHFFPEAFFTNDNKAVGYSDARAFQSKEGWAAYDTTFSVIFEEDDLYTGEERSLSFSYLSENLIFKGLSSERLSISVCFDQTKSQVTLKAGLDGTDTELASPVSFEFEDGKEYTFGVSVAENHIRVFHDSTLLMEYVDTNNQYYIGHVVEGVEPTILLWWNTGNTLSFTDVKVSSPEYLYPATPVAAVTTTATPTTTKISEVIVTDKDGNEVTDDSGNKVTETVVITDAPVADTNTGAVAGGNSTSTGDKAVIVVAAMIVALGSALIVRKVSVR